MHSIKLPTYLLIAAVICLPACSAGSGSDSGAVSLVADTGLTSNLVSNDIEATLSGANENLILNDAVNDDINIEFIRVKNHLVECEGNQVGHCLLIQKEGNEDWVYFYDDIEGFEFEWGSDYELLIQTQTVTPILPIDSNVKYTLLEVLSVEQAATGDAFSYTTRNSQERIVEIAPQQFSLLGETTFVCDEDDCNTLRSAMDQQQATLLYFQHNSNPEVPLLLESVLCADAVQSFTESCL